MKSSGERQILYEFTHCESRKENKKANEQIKQKSLDSQNRGEDGGKVC